MFQPLKNDSFNKNDTADSNESMNPTIHRTFSDFSQRVLPHVGSSEQFKFNFN